MVDNNIGQWGTGTRLILTEKPTGENDPLWGIVVELIKKTSPEIKDHRFSSYSFSPWLKGSFLLIFMGRTKVINAINA